MKKMLSIGLALIMACSFVLIGRGKADAMDNASAAILAGTVAIIGGAVASAIASDAYASDRIYADRRPVIYHEVRTRIIYDRPSYKSYDRPYRRPWQERARLDHERGRRHDRW